MKAKRMTVPDMLSRKSDDVIVASFVQKTHVQFLSEIAKSKETEMIIAYAELEALPTDELWAQEQRKDKELFGIIRWHEAHELPAERIVAKEILLQANNFALFGEHKLLVRVTNVEPNDKALQSEE